MVINFLWVDSYSFVNPEFLEELESSSSSPQSPSLLEQQSNGVGSPDKTPVAWVSPHTVQINEELSLTSCMVSSHLLSAVPPTSRTSLVCLYIEASL